MHAKKRRQKERRLANRLSEQAWQAADDGNFDLAAKIIRRAVRDNRGNPLLWHDQGTLLLQLHDKQGAWRLLETAIQLCRTSRRRMPAWRKSAPARQP